MSSSNGPSAKGQLLAELGYPDLQVPFEKIIEALAHG